MTEEVRLNRVHDLLESLDYPLSRDEARTEVADVTLVYADGEEPLADVIARSNDDTFEDVEDLEAEIYRRNRPSASGLAPEDEGRTLR